MKIFHIICLLVLWLILFGTCAAFFFLNPNAGWNLIFGAAFGFVFMMAASMFINEAFN
jgi:ABC-type xylose transport system permease subunit